MFTLAVLSALFALALAAPSRVGTPEYDTFWESYKTAHNKRYTNGEENLRRIIWEDNLKYITRHNLEADMGKHSYWLGTNEYADMTNREFRAALNNFKLSSGNRTGSTFLAPSHVTTYPDTVDWTTKGFVTPIKNQGQCGSCWAFSTTGSLEGQHFKKTGRLVSLSEQNLVDCSKANHGCEGGSMDLAFDYIKQNNGIDTEVSYPYKAKDLQCKFDSSNIGATVTGHTDIPSRDEKALMEAVATVGPVSVAIDAGHQSFQLYRSGIYDEPRCSQTKLDHGVLAVGFGTGPDYWLVKNSWGTSWGMNGYIRMSRNRNNQCGIATAAVYPLV